VAIEESEKFDKVAIIFEYGN